MIRWAPLGIAVGATQQDLDEGGGEAVAASTD